MAQINWQPLPDPLVEAKTQKQNELDQACKQSIIGKFLADVDGVMYYFYNDIEAQANFGDAKASWMGGDLLPEDTIPWTAYNVDGSVVRLQLNKAQFDPVNRARMQWKLDCIGKYRDVLLPQVESVTVQNGDVQSALDMVNSITWGSTP